MFRTRHQSQIRRFIISSIAICMMYNFMTFQRPAQNLRHYQAMFVNATSFISHRIFRAVKSDISIADVSPIRITLPSQFSSVLAYASHTSKRFSAVISTTRNKTAFATIRTCDFCTISTVDFLKIRILSCFGNSFITTSPTSEKVQFPNMIIFTRNKAALAAIRTCNFCIIYAIDFMKFLVRFHSVASMQYQFEKSKTIFQRKEVYHSISFGTFSSSAGA